MLESTNLKEQYDTEVKKILSDKTILAWILQYSIQEFAGYSIEEIRDCIEGEPEVQYTITSFRMTPQAIYAKYRG